MSNTVRVLLVEDNPGDVGLIRAALEEVPYSGLTPELTSASCHSRPCPVGSFSAKAVRAVEVADQRLSIHPGPVHIAFFVRGKTRRGAMPLPLPTCALA